MVTISNQEWGRPLQTRPRCCIPQPDQPGGHSQADRLSPAHTDTQGAQGHWLVTITSGDHVLQGNDVDKIIINRRVRQTESDESSPRPEYIRIHDTQPLVCRGEQELNYLRGSPYALLTVCPIRNNLLYFIERLAGLGNWGLAAWVRAGLVVSVWLARVLWVLHQPRQAARPRHGYTDPDWGHQHSFNIQSSALRAHWHCVIVLTNDKHTKTKRTLLKSWIKQNSMGGNCISRTSLLA